MWDDAEVIGYLISKASPLFWKHLSHKVQDCVGEVFLRWILPVMGDVTVHYGPEPLDGFMPMFRVAANLILEEMEPFRKYGREPHLDLSTCSQYIRLRLTVQKKATKAISYNWINVLYKPDGDGQVAVNADGSW